MSKSKLQLDWEKLERDARDVLVAQLFCLALAVAVAAMVAGWLVTEVNTLRSWVLGLFFSLVVGGFACHYFLCILRDTYMRNPKPKGLGPTKGVPPWLVGFFESSGFTVAIGATYAGDGNLGGIFLLMGVWLGAKMLAGWNRDVTAILHDKPPKEREQKIEERSRGAFTALLAGALNMVMAVIGGNIAGGKTMSSIAVSTYQFLSPPP